MSRPLLVTTPRCPKFPELPLVGKLTSPKPQPTFEVRVDDAGNIEVNA